VAAGFKAANNRPSAQRSAVMRSVKGENNKFELAIRSLLKAKRFRYEVYADLPGKPDIVLSRRKVVLRIMGCFWHGHPCARGNRQPNTNAEYWRKKISNNKLRDRRTKKELIKLGWRVIDVWECQAKKDDFTVKLIEKIRLR
jgi:DNA mismatch endonuclease (patch repair protein)